MSEMCNVCGKYKSWCDARHGAEVVRLRAALARAEAERDANEAERLRRVLALLLMLEATEAERDRLREERDGFRDTYHEQLTLRQQAEAERDAALKRESVLREALTTLIAATDPLDSIRRYDEIADAFERETGYWPPGRSRPLAMGGESPMREQEAREAWRAFCNRWHEAKTADARRALAAPADPALMAHPLAARVAAPGFAEGVARARALLDVTTERDELRTLVERWTTALHDSAAADKATDDARAWLAAHPRELTAPEATVAGTSTPAAPPAPDPHR